MHGDNGFTKAFKANVTEYRELNCGDPNFNNKAKSVTFDFEPDLIFIQIQTPNIITEDTARILRANCKFIVNWTGDVRTPIPRWYYDIGKHIDYTCFTNMTDVEQMNKDGIPSKYLEIGFDPTIYKHDGDVIPTKDIVFFGNNYGDGYFPLSSFRVQMCNYMRSVFGVRFGVYGNGWRISNGDFNNSQIRESEAYRGSKIAINVSHFEYKRYSSDRLLRLLGTGVPICLAKWYPDIEKDYKDGVHLRTWKTLDELRDLCIYYLKPENEKERLKIVKNGSKLAHKMFTFDNMIKNLIAIYNGK
jgi:hypothetical protein